MPDEGEIQALIEEGRECLDAGEYDRAIAIGEQLEQYRHSYAFELMALAYAAKDDLPAAIKVLERGVSLAPAVWLLWQLLGNYYSDMARYLDAREAYAHALECPTVDPSSVYYNSALLSLREGKFSEALLELDKVSGSKLAWKAASRRISIYADMGNVNEAISYAEQILREVAAVNEEEMDEDQAADVAGLYGEYANAVWRHGDAQQALALAWQAVSWWKQEETSLWLIREIEGMHSSHARYHHLIIEGVWSELFDGEDSTSGFFVTYGVVADTPDEAFSLAVRFEPADVRETLRLDECDVSPEISDVPKGVYEISDYFCFPAEDAD